MSDNNTVTPEQPLDPNMTIDVVNDELEALLVNYAKEQNVDALNALVKHIHDCRILVPATVNEEKKPIPCFIRNQNGQLFLPIYTSKGQIPAQPKSPAIMNMPFMAANKLVMKGEQQCDGIVINPFTNNLIFKNELIKRIDEVEEVQKKIPKPQTLKLSPKEYVLFERNQFEYRFFPKKLFELGEEFVNTLCADKEGYIDTLYEESYQQKRLYGFLEEDFSVMPMTISDELLMIRVDMPARDMNVNSCERVYISWKKADKAGRYFTVERSQQGLQLGEVLAEGRHVLHGPAPVEGAELQTLIDMVNEDNTLTS